METNSHSSITVSFSSEANHFRHLLLILTWCYCCIVKKYTDVAGPLGFLLTVQNGRWQLCFLIYLPMQTQSPTRIVPFYMLPLLLIFSQFTILYLYCLHYVIVAHCWAMVYAVAYCSFPIQLFLFPGVDSCFNFYNFSRLNFLCLCQYFFFSHILTKDGMSSITPDKYSS